MSDSLNFLFEVQELQEFRQQSEFTSMGITFFIGPFPD